jgi:hypothetical protein
MPKRTAALLHTCCDLIISALPELEGKDVEIATTLLSGMTESLKRLPYDKKLHKKMTRVVSYRLDNKVYIPILWVSELLGAWYDDHKKYMSFLDEFDCQEVLGLSEDNSDELYKQMLEDVTIVLEVLRR